MTQVHPGINIRLQYIRNTSEIHSEFTYTSTPPLNWEGIILTQFSAQVFSFVSSRSSSSPCQLQVFFIFKSSSSSSHLHHRIWIITRSGSVLDIITGSGSSLDLDHHWTSSLDLDHHSIWIITTGSSSLDHHHSI